MPVYQCSVFADAEEDLYSVAEFPFEFDGADPGATFTFDLEGHTDGGGVAALVEPSMRENVAQRVAGAAVHWVSFRGGLADPTTVAGQIARGLARIAPPAVPTRDYVVGSSSWGDIFLTRQMAEEWAETARLLAMPITWAELCHRLPATTRGEVIGAMRESFLAGHNHENDEELDDLPAGLVEEWSWELTDETGWPWLAMDDYQVDFDDFPQSVREVVLDSAEWHDTSDGEYLAWEDADELIIALTGAGMSVVRDDELVDRALGPYGSDNHHALASLACSACSEEIERACENHPLPTLIGSECPACHTGQMVRIGYGFPDFSDGWPGDWYVGGCLVGPGKPTHACRACGLHLDAEGTWLRRSFSDEPTPVARRRQLPLAEGLKDLFLAGIAAFGAPVTSTVEQLDHLIPIGHVDCRWWSEVTDLGVACSYGCVPLLPESAAPISSYLLTGDGLWVCESGPEWTDSATGLIRVHSVHEPIGSVVFRRADDTVGTVRGADAAGLAEKAMEWFFPG